MWRAAAAMTMDLYVRLVDDNLWTAAKRVDDASEGSGDHTGTDEASGADDIGDADEETGW